MRQLALTVAWAALLSILPGFAFAQSQGGITGVIRDATDASVPNVLVTVEGSGLPAPVNRDLQVQRFVGLGLSDVRNAASARITGAEVEVLATPAGRLQLAGNLSWLHARYERFIASVAVGVDPDVSGNRLNVAPDWSGSGSMLYEVGLGRAGTATVRGDVSWQSLVFFTPFNDSFERQGAYGLVHLRAGVEPRDRRWELAVFVRNAANQEYITVTGTTPLAPSYNGRLGESRHWGTQFTIRY